MARTVITRTRLGGTASYEGVTLPFTAGDAGNGNACILQGGETVLVQNSGAVPRTVTIKSAPDNLARTRDTTQSIPAGETQAFGPLSTLGWRQSDGYLHIDVAHADLLLCVIAASL